MGSACGGVRSGLGVVGVGSGCGGVRSGLDVVGVGSGSGCGWGGV